MTQVWPIAALREELVDSRDLKTPAEEAGTDELSVTIFAMLSAAPDSQISSRRVSEDIDWLMADDCELSVRMQDALVRGFVAGAASIKPSKPKDFIRDVSQSLVALEGVTGPGENDREFAYLSRLIGRGRRRSLKPQRVDSDRLVAACSKLDVNALRLVQALLDMSVKSRSSAAQPALMSGNGDVSAWTNLLDRVRQSLDLAAGEGEE